MGPSKRGRPPFGTTSGLDLCVWEELTTYNNLVHTCAPCAFPVPQLAATATITITKTSLLLAPLLRSCSVTDPRGQSVCACGWPLLWTLHTCGRMSASFFDFDPPFGPRYGHCPHCYFFHAGGWRLPRSGLTPLGDTPLLGLSIVLRNSLGNLDCDKGS